MYTDTCTLTHEVHSSHRDLTLIPEYSHWKFVLIQVGKGSSAISTAYRRKVDVRVAGTSRKGSCSNTQSCAVFKIINRDPSHRFTQPLTRSSPSLAVRDRTTMCLAGTINTGAHYAPSLRLTKTQGRRASPPAKAVLKGSTKTSEDNWHVNRHPARRAPGGPAPRIARTARRGSTTLL